MTILLPAVVVVVCEDLSIEMGLSDGEAFGKEIGKFVADDVGSMDGICVVGGKLDGESVGEDVGPVVGIKDGEEVGE